MGIGPEQRHAIGFQKTAFFSEESPSAFGTPVAPVGADAVRLLEFEVNADVGRYDPEDSSPSRSSVETLSGRRDVSFRILRRLRPSGTGQTPPDEWLLNKAVFGVQTINASDVTWSLAGLATAFTPITGRCGFSDVLQIGFRGGVLDKWKLMFDGQDGPRCEYTGRARSEIWTAVTTVNGDNSDGSPTIDDVYHVDRGSVISIEGVGTHHVTAVNRTTGVITLASTPSILDADEIAPALPAETVAGTALPATAGTLTIGGVSYKCISGMIELDNGHRPVNDELGTDEMTDVLMGKRKVMGEFDIRCRRDQAALFMDRSFTQKSTVLTLGDTAGRRYTATLPYGEYKYAKHTIPRVDEVLIKLAYDAKGSAGDDELTWMHH